MLEETWLADLIQNSGNEIFIIDARSLALLEVSEAVRRNLQYSASDIWKLSAHDLLCDLSAKELHQIVDQLRAGDASTMTVQSGLLRSDGSRCPSSLQMSFLQLSTLSALIAVGSRQQIRSNREERYAQIEAHVPGLLFQMRRGRTGVLQFSFLSQACQDLLGQPSEAFYANPTRFLAMIIEENRQDWTEKLQDSARTLATFNWEGRVWIDAWQDNKWINLRATPRDEGDDGILWTGLMTNITQSRKLHEEIRRSREKLTELTAYIDDVRENERERIERDLHDDLGGNLSALKMMLEFAWKELPVTPFLEERKLQLNQLIDRSIESIHRIAIDLRPGILDAGLVAALEWLAQENTRQDGIPYLLHCSQQDIVMHQKLATSLFRIAQESCNNIRKHANASQVDIYLHACDDELLMEVIDNGIGLSNARRDDPHSFGLRGMSERIRVLGGEFGIVSRSGKGTMVRVSVPLREQIQDQ
jgi:signal transduction histidine kinase